MPNIITRSPCLPQEWNAYYRLRWQILRAPYQQPIGSEKDELENEAFHACAFTEQQEVVGVARLHRLDERSGQIRYMAVSEFYQKRGIGLLLINYLEALAVSHNIVQIKLNARESAVPFYQKAGYHIFAKGVLLYGIIPHQWMTKILG